MSAWIQWATMWPTNSYCVADYSLFGLHCTHFFHHKQFAALRNALWLKGRQRPALNLALLRQTRASTSFLFGWAGRRAVERLYHCAPRNSVGAKKKKKTQSLWFSYQNTSIYPPTEPELLFCYSWGSLHKTFHASQQKWAQTTSSSDRQRQAGRLAAWPWANDFLNGVFLRTLVGCSRSSTPCLRDVHSDLHNSIIR